MAFRKGKPREKEPEAKKPHHLLILIGVGKPKAGGFLSRMNKPKPEK